MTIPIKKDRSSKDITEIVVGEITKLKIEAKIGRFGGRSFIVRDQNDTLLGVYNASEITKAIRDQLDKNPSREKSVNLSNAFTKFNESENIKLANTNFIKRFFAKIRMNSKENKDLSGKLKEKIEAASAELKPTRTSKSEKFNSSEERLKDSLEQLENFEEPICGEHIDVKEKLEVQKTDPETIVLDMELIKKTSGKDPYLF